MKLLLEILINLRKHLYYVYQVAELTYDKFVDFRGAKTLYNI